MVGQKKNALTLVTADRIIDSRKTMIASTQPEPEAGSILHVSGMSRTFYDCLCDGSDATITTTLALCPLPPWL